MGCDWAQEITSIKDGYVILIRYELIFLFLKASILQTSVQIYFTNYEQKFAFITRMGHNRFNQKIRNYNDQKNYFA
jgi:hypothetical protein